MAPLVLVPVDLERTKVRSSFKLRWTGEDIQTNISLLAKAQEQGVTLLEFEAGEEKEDIDRYFDAVRKAISGILIWEVVEDIYLDFFSFTKFVMYKDLDPTAWPEGRSPAEHPLIKSILTPESNSSSFSGFSEDEIDTKLTSRNVYHVMDADPSQIAVIEDVKTGYNLVVQGPPGTGKSQTIANIIAELLAAGRSVLFVSEKMAALEVVKSRLDSVGLGDFCLELHSRKASKREVLKDLERTLSTMAPDPVSIEGKLDNIEQLKSDLNGYASALREPFAKLRRSPFGLFCLKETALRHFDEVGRDMPRARFQGAEFCTLADWKEAETRLSQLSKILTLVAPISKHPWYGCDPGEILPSDQDETGDLILECEDGLADLEKEIDRLCSQYPIKKPQTLEALEQVLDTLRKFEEDILQEDVDSILGEYKVLSAKFFRILYSRYRYLKRRIRGFYRGHPERKRKIIIGDLDQTRGIQARDDIGEHKPDERADVVAEAIVEARDRFLKYWGLLIKKVGLEFAEVFGETQERVPFTIFQGRLDRYENGLSTLQRWAQFMALRKVCLNSFAAPVVDVIDRDEIEPEDALPCFEGNVADEILRHVFAERPELSNFVGEIHENKIQQFVELDRELIVRNRHRLVQELCERRPRISGGASAGSEAGILLGEISRKRGHMPIRKLMSQVGGLVQKIKLCFMMSPLSIAQFLDPKTAQFDVIIFDEASQVKPEDALGALLRGRQVVVMGDTRQLPPTSFFDHILNAEEDEDEVIASISDVESILHQCKRSFPTKTLRWHYRSRHESLIAVSNQEFYDNQLLIYPSAIDRSKDLGLQFVHLEDTIYDRGRSSTNRLEARAVAEAAVEHFRQSPDKSLGVGAFNIKQQQAILEEVELQLRNNPDVEDLFSSSQLEPFFVKNLETIQGDERDVIFLSVGFGFDANRRLSRNFGPLNREGGERRLNVLITRARERCVVFSNFRASDLSLDGNAPFGVRALKMFLDYAENRNLVASEAIGADTDSPFEDSVYEFLRSNGYEVRKQVGCAGFRVDLGIVDPEAPGRYLLGVECDGAKYHSAPVARDRDRLRQQILENLRWCIYRIWSTDWYRDRVESQQNLLKAVERAKFHRGNPAPNSSSPSQIVLPEKPETFDYNSEDNAGELLLQDPLEKIVPEYEVCFDLGIPIQGNLHEQYSQNLAAAITRIVEVEGPVLVDEVIRRIRTLWGHKRSGPRIQRVVARGIAFAEQEGDILRKGRFLWPPGMDHVSVRRRTGDPPPQMELICDEEIEAAVTLVLENQFDTPPQDLCVKVSRLFGMKRTTDTTVEQVLRITNRMVENGRLEQTLSAMIHLIE